ncbi:MAG: hypothetical protein H0U66_14530 [Gemmatimonadaceae bacterium]|nr:hypothetical protein [Gemmatimonadaceae bacterium]
MTARGRASTPVFTYDVAISFLWPDRAVAEKIKAGLDDTLSVFLSTREQERLAGQDGLSTFGPIYQSEARLVVTLYRPSYGTTKWTRVEMNAIKSRGLDNGWDFFLLVLLEGPGPKWYESFHLYAPYDGNPSDVLDIIGAIKYKARQQGATLRVLSLDEKAEREAAARDAKVRRLSLIRSTEGMQLAHREVQKLFGFIKTKADAIAKAQHNIRIEVESEGDQLVMRHNRCSIELYWSPLSYNLESGNVLYVREYDGFKALDRGRGSLRGSKLRAEGEIAFDIRDDAPYWNRSKGALDPTRLQTSEQLGEELIERAWKFVPRPQWTHGGPHDPYG